MPGEDFHLGCRDWFLSQIRHYSGLAQRRDRRQSVLPFRVTQFRLVEPVLLETLHERSHQLCNQLGGIFGSCEDMSFQENSTLCKRAECEIVCCGTLSSLRTEKRGAAIESHNLTCLFCVCDMANAIYLDTEFVCAMNKTVVECRMKMTFKQHPGRRSEILQRHGGLIRALVLFVENNGERNSPNDRAAQEGIIHGVADNGQIEFTATHAGRKLARGLCVEQNLQPRIKWEFKRAENRKQPPVREYRLSHRDSVFSSIQCFARGDCGILRVRDRQSGTLNIKAPGISGNDTLILATASLEQAGADVLLNSGQCSGDAGLSHSNPARSTMEVQLLRKSDNYTEVIKAQR